MTVRRRRLRMLDGFVAGVAVLAVFVLLAARPASVRAQAEPLEVEVSWTSATREQFRAWTDEFFAAEQPVEFSGVVLPGETIAKNAVINGTQQFVVASEPLTEAEQQRASDQGRQIAAIPLAPTGLVVGVRAPKRGDNLSENQWLVEIVDDPETGDSHLENLPADEPLRLPMANIATAYLGGSALRLPEDPAFTDAMAPWIIVPSFSATATEGVVRSDPSGVNRELLRYLRHFDPALVESSFRQAGVPVDHFGVDWARKTTPSRSGLDAMGFVLGGGGLPSGDPAVGAKASNASFGLFTLAEWRIVKEMWPGPDMRAAEIENAAGEWVAPTPDSVEKGIQAGVTADGFEASATLDDPDATDAYPLTWLNWMLVPTTGLPPAELNAIANLARYAVTGGQTVQAEVGEPTLPSKLVDQALATIDEVVGSNCADADGTLRTASDPGPSAPPKSAFTGVDEFLLCDEAVVPAATTTTVARTTSVAPTTTAAPAPTSTTAAPETTPPPGGANSNAGGGNRNGGSRSSSTTVPATSSPPADVPTTTPPISDGDEEFVPSSAELPFGTPIGSRQVEDQFATMAVGGSLTYGVVRRFFLRGR